MDIKEFHVRLTLTEDMLGTSPKDRPTYTKYVGAKAFEDKQLKAQQEPDAILERVEEEAADAEDAEASRGWTGFHSDERGIYMLDYQIRGFLKEAGNVLKASVGEEGAAVSALKSKIDQYCFVFPRKIYVTREADGKLVNQAEPEFVFERPLRAMTMQGPRVTLVKSDVVTAGAQLSFIIKVLPNPAINKRLLTSLLEYGQFQGLGQFRNGSFGRFEFELEEVK